MESLFAPGEAKPSEALRSTEVLNEDFGGQHQEFIGDLQPHLQADGIGRFGVLKTGAILRDNQRFQDVSSSP